MPWSVMGYGRPSVPVVSVEIVSHSSHSTGLFFRLSCYLSISPIMLGVHIVCPCCALA